MKGASRRSLNGTYATILSSFFNRLRYCDIYGYCAEGNFEKSRGESVKKGRHSGTFARRGNYLGEVGHRGGFPHHQLLFTVSLFYFFDCYALSQSIQNKDTLHG